jgi:hypothetical protein
VWIITGSFYFVLSISKEVFYSDVVRGQSLNSPIMLGWRYLI